MKNKILYWTLILLVTLGMTMLVQFLFREYRFMHLSKLNYIGNVEFVFTAILLPIYLATVYFALNRKFKFVGHFPTYILLTIICIVISARIDFINWWDTEGKIIDVKDAETRDVIELGLAFQFIIAVIIDILCLFVSRSLNKTIEMKTI
jgi:hypothetical protein